MSTLQGHPQGVGGKTDSVPLPLPQEGFLQSVEPGPAAWGYVSRQQRKERQIEGRNGAHNSLLVNKENGKGSAVLGTPLESPVSSILNLITTPGDEHYCFLFYI